MAYLEIDISWLANLFWFFVFFWLSVIVPSVIELTYPYLE